MNTHQIENPSLLFLLNSGDIFGRRSLLFTVESEPTAYVTEYKMHSVSGEFCWYTTWLHPESKTTDFQELASIYVHPARARLYFPAFLDTRIPPANREGLEKILKRFHMTSYDKFELICRSTGVSPIKRGTVQEVEALDCRFPVIHAIEEIKERYLQSIQDRISRETQAAPGFEWVLPD